MSRRAPSAIFPVAAPAEGATGHHSLRHRIRGLERLLRKPGLAVQAHKDKTRLLRKLQAQQSEKSVQAREVRYAERYKAVRFYEQQKAARRLKAARKAAEGGGDAQQRAASCEADVAYVKWFPRHLRYVALYADAAKSADAKLLARRAALRAWALANAAAGAFLLSPPEGAEAAGAEDGEAASEEEGGGEEGALAEGAAAEAQVAAPAPQARRAPADAPPPQQQQEPLRKASKRKRPEDAAEPAAPPPAAPAAAALERVSLPSRPQPPKPSRRHGTAAASGADADLEAVDEFAAVGAAGAQGPSISAPAPDPFFYSLGSAGASDAGAASAPPPAPLVFVEEAGAAAWGDEDGGGAAAGGGGGGGGATASWRGDFARPVYGARTSAARYERENLAAPRYRDFAVARGVGGGAPAGAAAQQRPAEEGAGAGAAAGLSGRKLKRAERAMAFNKGAGGSGGGAGGGRETEAFFGTDKDPLARLKSQGRVERSERVERERFSGGARGGQQQQQQQQQQQRQQRLGQGQAGAAAQGRGSAASGSGSGSAAAKAYPPKPKATDKRTHMVFD